MFSSESIHGWIVLLKECPETNIGSSNSCAEAPKCTNGLDSREIQILEENPECTKMLNSPSNAILCDSRLPKEPTKHRERLRTWILVKSASEHLLRLKLPLGE